MPELSLNLTHVIIMRILTSVAPHTRYTHASSSIYLDGRLFAAESADHNDEKKINLLSRLRRAANRNYHSPHVIIHHLSRPSDPYYTRIYLDGRLVTALSAGFGALPIS